MASIGTRSTSGIATATHLTARKTRANHPREIRVTLSVHDPTFIVPERLATVGSDGLIGCSLIFSQLQYRPRVGQ